MVLGKLAGKLDQGQLQEGSCSCPWLDAQVIAEGAQVR